MRKIALGVIVAWMMTVNAIACDVCGGSSAGSFLGILPQYQKHFVGLTYQYQSFNSVHPVVDGQAVPTQSQDYFHSTTLWGRFYPFKKLQAFAFLPFQYNYVVENGTTTRMDGIGDARLLLNYMVLNTADSAKSEWKHTLLAGGGVKAPTGRNDYTNKEGIILSNMQPGTGAWDFILNTNYTIRYRRIGLNTDISYQVATVNKRDYLYGDKINAGLAIFSWLRAVKLSFLPQAGLRYMHSTVDLSSNTYKIRNSYSGGYQLYTTVGSGFYLERMAFTGLISLPVKENYANGLVKSNPRIELQIQYLF